MFSVCFPFHPASDVLRTFLQEVAKVAPSLPFYYYHIPNVTGVHGEFCWHLILHLAAAWHWERSVKCQAFFYQQHTECETVISSFFFSAGERGDGRYWEAHSLFQWCEVQWKWSDGFWPVCQLQPAALVTPLWRGWGQPFLLLFCLYCSIMR